MSNHPLCKPARVLALLVFCLAFGAAGAAAQSTTDGAIGGTVKDPNGAIVTGAAVTVRSEETNRESTATTDGEGRFRVTQLQPGRYTVTVTASGFANYTQQNVVVEVGRVNTLEAQLGVAGAQEVVEVSGEAPVIETTRQDFSTNINQTSINELPINGRRWSNFAILSPGATPDGNFGLISFRGISGLLNNSTVDGGDNNQAFFSEERGRTRIGYSISQSAIREFQVNTSNYSAEYGRAAGGVVNAVTKSGTNEFHGDVFYYQRNNRLGARNPRAFQSVFVPGVGTNLIGIKPKDVRHQFGGAVGGPIVRDRAFFFFSYDEQRRDFPGLGIFSNPSFLTTVNRGTTGAGLRAANRNLTDAQIDAGLAFLNSLTGEVPRKGNQRLFLPKLDWQINNSNTFTATYNRLRWDSPAGIQTQATNTRGRASFGDDFVQIDWLTLRLASTISPTVLNEFRFQAGRDNEFQISQPPLAGEPTTALGGTRAPSVFITGGLEFGTPTFLERRAFPDEKRWQYADTMTVSRGQHTLKFGVDINHVRDVIDNLRFEAGSYSYNNINDFIIDYINSVTTGGLPNTVCSANPARRAGRCYTSNYQQGFGTGFSEFSSTDLNFFIQDDYRVNSRLTLNLGLRYEYQKLPDPQIPNPALPLTGRMPKDKNNFGPRIGAAYDLTGDGRTSLRAGYGIYFGRTPNAQVSNALTNTGRLDVGQQQVQIAPTAANAPIFPNVVSSAAFAGSVAAQFFAANFENPEIHQADVVFERQIARNTAVSVSYLVSVGRKLPTYIDTNLCPPGRSGTNCATVNAASTITYTVANGPFGGQSFTVPLYAGARPIAGFGALTEIRSDVRSDYHGLVLQANRRFTDGLQFQASYTLASARDTGQTSAAFPLTNAPQDPFNPVGESGTSNFDVRNKVVASVVWAPDNIFGQGDGWGRRIFDGFTIAPIFQYYSGRPFNATTSGNAPGGTAGGLLGAGGANRFPLIARNSFREPKLVNFDLRVSRRFRLTESANFEVLAEAFNLFNRTQVTQLNSQIYSLSGTTLNFVPAFGTVSEASGTLFRERQIQLAARFQF
jgi:hypothetical protein